MVLDKDPEYIPRFKFQKGDKGETLICQNKEDVQALYEKLYDCKHNKVRKK